MNHFQEMVRRIELLCFRQVHDGLLKSLGDIFDETQEQSRQIENSNQLSSKHARAP
jgi:hypothetical protein